MISQLAQLVFEVSDLRAWGSFASEILGVEVVSFGEGLRLRWDRRPWRVELREGPADDLVEVRWQVGDAVGLETLLQGLRTRGVPTEGPCFVDPGGVPTRLVLPSEPGPEPRLRYRGGFVADDQGLGHVVLSCPTREAGETFYRELGFRLSDRIVTRVGEWDIDLAFLHVNRRHHSLALGGPQRKRLHHLMLQLQSFDDLGKAMHRAMRAGCLATTLGRHPNDRILSFYVTTPSGFQVELGQGGVELDPAHVPCTYERIAVWGHHHLESP